MYMYRLTLHGELTALVFHFRACKIKLLVIANANSGFWTQGFELTIKVTLSFSQCGSE